MADNEYTINILNADQLYVEGKRIQQLDLGRLVEKDDNVGIGINNSFPKLIFDISGTDGLRIPTGTTLQRPTANLYDNLVDFEGPDKLFGVIRFNKDSHKFEGWLGKNDTYNIGSSDSSWGNFIQEDNDKNELKLSQNVDDFKMQNFFVHTLEAKGIPSCRN